MEITKSRFINSTTYTMTNCVKDPSGTMLMVSVMRFITSGNQYQVSSFSATYNISKKEIISLVSRDKNNRFSEIRLCGNRLLALDNAAPTGGRRTSPLKFAGILLARKLYEKKLNRYLQIADRQERSAT